MRSDDSDARCEQLRHPDLITLILAIIIVVGMLISYLPQHIRIIQRRTAEGISPYFILLGTTSATAGFANILLLPQSRQDVSCCRQLETAQCLIGLLGIGQLGIQWTCFGFIFVLFLVFFRYNTATVPQHELGGDQPSWKEVLVVSSLILLHGLGVLVITAVIGTVDRSKLDIWADVLGVMAACLAAIQYIPQIWTTYHLKHVGSLSIPMMLIQTPGGLLFATSLFLRLGWRGWSSWGIFVLTAIMQGCLLCMAIYYEVHNRRSARVPKSPVLHQAHPHVQANGLDDGLDAVADAERAPLLRAHGTGVPSSSYTHLDRGCAADGD